MSNCKTLRPKMNRNLAPMIAPRKKVSFNTSFTNNPSDLTHMRDFDRFGSAHAGLSDHLDKPVLLWENRECVIYK